MKKKLFISDLHLGDGSRTDDFHRDSVLLEFFDFARREAEELIIVGDFMELWQADLDRVMFRHSEVINALLALRQKIKVTYVIGNHDYIPFIKFTDAGVGVCLEYRDDDCGIIAEHGHRYDIINRYTDPLNAIKWPAGHRFARIVGGLERILNPNADVWARRALENVDDFLRDAMRVRNKVTPASPEYIKRGGHFGEFEEAVARRLSAGARIVIFGHTHRAQLKRTQQGIYANCGAWVDDVEPTYLACYEDRIALTDALTHTVRDEVGL